MKNTFKKFAAVATALAMIFALASQAFAADLGNTTAPLRFNEDSTFKIMHVTDTHLEYYNLEESVWLISDACDKEKPDLIALTGDIAMSDDKEEMLACIDALMSVFEEREIPVAVTLGNHDPETPNFTSEELMKVYNSYSCSISVDEGDALTGCGTYNVPILASKSDDVKFNLWFFDSGSSDGEGHYSNVPADQVEWYKETSAKLERDCGGKVSSLVFQHIIVPEIYDALEKHDSKVAYSFEHIYNENEFYSFSPDYENHGVLNETPCPGYYNHGEFEAMVERGDVLGMFSGHDHTNAFSVKYKGINITNSLSTRYNGDAFSSTYGYRMIILDENDTSKYETYSVHWYDYFTLSDLFDAADSYGRSLTAKLLFLGFLQKSADGFALKFIYAFTGRQVSYE